MIHTYAVTWGPGTFFDRTLASENLGSVYYKIYVHPPSSSLRNRIALLGTCRRINCEAANISPADFGELTLVVDVSRARQHLDNYLVPQLDEDQMGRLRRTIVIVDFRPPGTGWQHYVERIMPCGTPYWAWDKAEVSKGDGLVEGYEGYEQYMNPGHVVGEKITLKMKQFYAIWRAGGTEFLRLQRVAGSAAGEWGKGRKAKF
ncbi:hypothetical protein MBLNU13_g03009t1 [Cladosporium sp. NU13]